ncbi:hypothetical protein WN943_000455 [Citrus x changshan-huyou]
MVQMYSDDLIILRPFSFRICIFNYAMGLEEDSGGADTGQFVVEKVITSHLSCKLYLYNFFFSSLNFSLLWTLFRNHLSSNLFFFYTFGKLVEEEEGNCGLWLSYIFSGAAANFVPWLILPKNAVSVGAAGAVFGLFAISVLVKMSWDRRKVLEVLILDELVVEKVITSLLSSMHFLFEISESSESCLLCSVGYGGSPSSSRNVGHFYWWLFSAEYQSHCNFIWCSLWCISGLLLSRVPSQCPENKALNLREKRDKTL